MENKNNFQKILQFLQLKSILKRKYLLSSIFVFAVVVTLFLPAQSAQACSFWEVGCKIKEAATGALLDLVAGILYLLGAAALYLLSYLVSFGAWLIDVMLEPKLYNTVLKFTTPPATPSTIQLGWQTVRDMSNMFFVFILLLIAFSTILRIQQYSAKNLMIKFITALFLINFSAVIAGIVIDFGQIFMYELRSWMGTFGGDAGSGGDLTSIVDITFRNKYPFWFPPEGGYSLENAMGAVFAAIFALVLGLVYIMLAGFLLIRVIMFAFLIILSPLAFLGIVMPGLGSESKEWWDKLFKYSLFGPVFMFFVYLSSNMASSLKNYDIATAEPDLGGLAFVGALVVKFAIPLGMLLMVIPVTKKLGGFGADKLVGGALGVGKIALGTYAGIKLAGGLGKKAVQAPMERLNAYGMGREGRYKQGMDKMSGILKTMPIAGRIFIERASEQARKHKEDVDKHQKVMENLSDKDKKAYADSFIDPKAKADAQQAMFNLLAKDSGKGMTNDRLQKMGYEKEITDSHGNKTKVFDAERFASDYNRAKAYGHDTSSFETYRPDMIKNRDEASTNKDKEDKVAKLVQDGNYKSIKGDALGDPVIAKKLEELIGKKKYDEFVNNKSQEEKNTIIKYKEAELAKLVQTPVGPMPQDIQERADEVTKRQSEIASLASAEDKTEKTKNINVTADGKIEYVGDVKVDVMQNTMDKMTKDQFIDLKPDFYEKFGNFVSESNIDHIARYGETEQLTAIKKAIVAEMAHYAPGSPEYAKLQRKFTKVENKM